MRWLSAGTAATAWVVVLGACASEQVVEDDGGPSTASATSTGTGSGGEGTGGSGAGSPSPCPTDCSAIETAQCLEAVCNPDTKQCDVVGTAAGTSCDDGLFCTVDDACDGTGTCQGGSQNDCGTAPNDCQDVVCDEGAKSCSTTPKADGTACTPGDLCLSNATCSAGTCTGGQPKDCFFSPTPNECYVSVCNPANGMCEPQIGNEGQPCTDQMDLCTVGKTCNMGTCVGGAPKDCSALTEGCVDGVCDPMTGSCGTQPIPAGMACASGTDACNSGICDMNGMCISSPINQGMACDDGLTCTTGEVCDASGGCPPGTSATTIYFYEDFSDNSAGWTLGPTWQIGAATASSGAMFGGTDPATDTSPTYDDGIAGAVIGGNIPVMVHPFYYLTSPVIDTSLATNVFLEYERWLNGSFPGFATEHVQVFDGTTWQTIFDSNNLVMPAADTAWTHEVFDVTPFKNANMQVRFGYDDTIGFLAVSGWNIDDVVIASAQCN